MANDWPTGGKWVTSPFHQISYLDSLAYKRGEIATEDQGIRFVLDESCK